MELKTEVNAKPNRDREGAETTSGGAIANRSLTVAARKENGT